MQSKFLILVVLISGCASGPIEIVPGAFAIPGGRLSGPSAATSSWSTVVSGDGVLDLETRPSDPYSVRIGFVAREDRIYVDPAPGREWLPHLEANPSVRVRIGQKIYRAKAVRVTSEAELEGFDPTRHVFRLEIVE